MRGRIRQKIIEITHQDISASPLVIWYVPGDFIKNAKYVRNPYNPTGNAMAMSWKKDILFIPYFIADDKTNSE